MSGECGRWTYTEGTTPGGLIIYDDGQKAHSNHDSDPAHGQSNSFDIVRLHRYSGLDTEADLRGPITARHSHKAMVKLALEQPEVRQQLIVDEGFEDLDATDFSWMDAPADSSDGAAGRLDMGLPARIERATSIFTDQENARRIQRKFGQAIISCGGNFYTWAGTHWSEGKVTRQLTSLSLLIGAEYEREHARLEAQGEVTEDDEKHLKRLWQWAADAAQAPRIRACEGLLKDLLAMPMTSLNRGAALFNCANGTLDLSTGAMRVHEPKDFLTACAPTPYDEQAQAPRFEAFLMEIFNEDKEVIAFAKRWFGYCITGEISEHKMLFHIGGGGNGKSTLMELLNFVLGSGYYSTASAKILNIEDSGATPDLARLLGRRMVTIAETDEALEMREGIIKQITGGDTINARQLYKEPIEFLPTHKLQVFTNFQPQIKGQDFAIWRRILLLEYPISFGDANEVARKEAQCLKDSKLEAALHKEAPGVLRWLVEGAREWYEQGLKPPESVLAATRRYREEQDRPGQFAKERIVADAKARAPFTGSTDAIFPAYRAWCTAMGYRPLGRNRFMKEMCRVISGALVTTWQDGDHTITGLTGLRLANCGPL